MVAITARVSSLDPFEIVKMAECPADYVEVYMNLKKQNNPQLLAKFFDEVKALNLDKKSWDDIEKWCKNLGLEDLKTKVYKIPPYVPVTI